MSLSGDRIRELRIQHDMTLDDVAKYLGINRQAVYKYEQGIVTNIPLDKIEKMALLFGTTPDYIAGWKEDHPDDPIPADDPQIHAVSTMMEGMSKEQKDQILAIVRTFVDHQPR